MAVEVHCPNGHKLICPEEFTGENVKCPRCGALTEVSARALTRSGMIAEAANLNLADASSSKIDLDDLADSSESVTMKQTHSPIPAGQMAFYCPNGHRLKGPLALQGKLGECPHCDARFRIPVFSDTETSEIEEAAIAPPEAPPKQDANFPQTLPAFGDAQGESPLPYPQETPPSAARAKAPGEPAPSEPGVVLGSSSSPAVFRWAEADDDGTEKHPLAQMLETLWEERREGGVFEFVLTNGERITPGSWSHSLSNAAYGVFASQTDDGAHQIDVVPWNDIARVTIRGVAELPAAQFD